MASNLQIPESANHVVFSINPKAGSGRPNDLAVGVSEILKANDQNVEMVSDIKLLQARSKELWDQGKLRGVVSVGGDGTAALIANTVAREIPVQICPTGTENLLAKYLKIPKDAKTIASNLLRGEYRKFDAGYANGTRFIIMASCGFDAEVVERLHRERKGGISHWSYAIPIWKSIRNYRYPELEIYCDDHPKPIKARWAFVFNFPCYAMGLKICPNATAEDSQFDLCTFRNGNLFNGLLYLAGVLIRKHRAWRDTHLENAQKIVIRSKEHVPFQIDGDPGGELPLELEMDPQSFPLVIGDEFEG